MPTSAEDVSPTGAARVVGNNDEIAYSLSTATRKQQQAPQQ